jgi:hypothetical protein
MKISPVQIAAVAAALAGVAAVWWFTGNHDRSTPTLAAPPGAVVVSESAPAESARVEALPQSTPEAPPRRTVRDYLAEYYGADWASVRETLERDRKDRLDQPLDESLPIGSWAAAREEVRSKIILPPEKYEGWSKAEVDLDTTVYDSWERVRAVFPNVPQNVGQRELDALRDIVKPHHDRAMLLGLERAAILGNVQALKFDSGGVRYAPFALPRQSSDVPGRRCIAQSTGSSRSGWMADLWIYEDELPPEYFQHWNDIAAAKLAADRAAKAYIDSL